MNNRELKFRAWDNLKKEWLKKKVYHLNFHFNEEGIGEFVAKQHPQGLTIQQFTGLLDAEGREIYEGDLVKVNLYDPEIGEVIFNHGGFCLQSKSFKGTFLGIVTGGFLIEVVGNVFETPELLKP